MSDIRFVLGGARSGKSSYAEKLASETALPVTYIAAAQVTDDAFKPAYNITKIDGQLIGHL